MIRAIRIHPDDNVATLVEPAPAGESIQVSGAGEALTVTAVEAVPRGHKVALAPIGAGGLVTKYGETIGRATAGIAPGACVHAHNLEGLRGRKEER